MSKDDQILEEFASKEYEHGWTVDFEADSAPPGLNEDIVRFYFCQERRARMAFRVEIKSLPKLEENDGA